MSGGCAKIPFLKDIIEEKANVSTEIIDCIRTIKYDENVFDPDYIKDIAPIASVGIGLGIEETGRLMIKINLLPYRDILRKKNITNHASSCRSNPHLGAPR